MVVETACQRVAVGGSRLVVGAAGGNGTGDAGWASDGRLSAGGSGWSLGLGPDSGLGAGGNGGAGTGWGAGFS
ncbi:MAG: hypothetical protein ACOY3P_23615 [Planctomycetota bacterium]